MSIGSAWVPSIQTGPSSGFKPFRVRGPLGRGGPYQRNLAILRKAQEGPHHGRLGPRVPEMGPGVPCQKLGSQHDIHTREYSNHCRIQ